MNKLKKFLYLFEFYLGKITSPSSKQGKEKRSLIYTDKEKFLKSKGF